MNAKREELGFEQARRRQETVVVVERLQRLVGEYVRPAPSMGLSLEGGQVASVIRQLAERTARGEGVPEFAPTPEGYFLQGLYEELAQESMAIFERVPSGEGAGEFRPISAASWQLVLDELAARVR
ncbi:MAG: hypothetical protein SNJ84_10205 [Verrucomicrobiia bacterium]